MRYRYQAIDGPVSSDIMAIDDDRFDWYSAHIEFTLPDGRVVTYKRRKRPFIDAEFATVNGDPTASDQEKVDWSRDSSAVRALIFVGYNG